MQAPRWGQWSTPLPPERSQVNYAPRVTFPVLMINGRYDHSFRLDTHIEPLFELFGAPAEDKRLALFDGGHVGFPPSFLLRESLDWLDRYLGPVKRVPIRATAATGAP